MIYKEYSGKNQIEAIEDINEDDPYTEIGPKAFLSKKEVEQLTLPSHITKVGQWGFAHMKNLRILTVPANEIEFGKDALLDCPLLKEIRVYPDKSENEGLPELLAVCVSILNRIDLINPYLSASSTEHERWIKTFDSVLIGYLNESDSKGFEPVLYGWFNDEGEDDQKNKYVKEKRYNKVKLCFLRLKYDYCLNESTREIINNYISNHFLGGKREDEHIAVYEYVIENLYNNLIDIKLLENSGALNINNRTVLINELSKLGANPEVLAFLLFKNSSSDTESAFDKLEL